MIAEADIRRVQDWMGHADVQTTMRYLHYAPRADDAALVAKAFAVTDVLGLLGTTSRRRRVNSPGLGDRSGGGGIAQRQNGVPDAAGDEGHNRRVNLIER